MQVILACFKYQSISFLIVEWQWTCLLEIMLIAGQKTSLRMSWYMLMDYLQCTRELRHVQTYSRREHFACYTWRTILSPGFLYHSSLMHKRYLTMWMWLCEINLKVKIAHFRLLSMSHTCACSSSLLSYPPVTDTSFNSSHFHFWMFHLSAVRIHSHWQINKLSYVNVVLQHQDPTVNPGTRGD